MRVIDSHVHIWNPERFHYSWLKEHPDFNRPFLLQDFEFDQLDGIIAVQADCRDDEGLAEALWLESMFLGGCVPLAGIVAFAPIDDISLRQASLDALGECSSVVGVRRLLQDEPDDFLGSTELRTGLEEIRERGWTFDACVRWHQLDALAVTVRAVPALRVVVDHLGKPPILEGIDSDSGRSWLLAMKRLAMLDDVAIKLSGLPAEAPARNVAETASPFLRAAIDIFGPGRCMFGSDWPVSTESSQTDYRSWFEVVIACLEVQERIDVLGGTAGRWYRIPARALGERAASAQQDVSLGKVPEHLNTLEIDQT